MSVELTHKVNESLSTNIFPDAWSLGSITPIPKEGDLMDLGNWRPITIVLLHSKLLRRAVHYQMLSHLNSHDLFLPKQHGFRKGQRTSTAIMIYLGNLLIIIIMGTTRAAFLRTTKKPLRH